MKAEFSEFSYGFALSFEILNAFRPQVVGVPLFPSLLQETKRGYDVEFPISGSPLFLQFKLADYMITRRAAYWSYYNRRYYRISIYRRKHSEQHNRLRDLVSAEPLVFYVAPSFHTQPAFNKAFASNCIMAQSAFFSLGKLPDLADDDQHHITFCEGEPGFRWHSTTGHFFDEDISGEAWLEAMRSIVSRPRELGAGFFSRLRRILVEIIRTSDIQTSFLVDDLINLNNDEPLVVIRDLRYLLITYFGVEPIILRPVTPG